MPIRTAVVGYGTAGSVFHAPFLEANNHFTTEMVVTASPANAARAKRNHRNVNVVSRIEEVLHHSSQLDLVVVASPPDTHVEMAHRCIDKGLAVVIDKPLCPTRREAAELIEHAESEGVLLTVYQNRRWDGDFMTLKQLVAEGRLGRLHRLESSFEWWKPRETKSWKREMPASAGGGILFDLGSHLIDQAIQLLGPVQSAQGEVRQRRGFPAADDAFVSLQHKSGITSHLYMNSISAQVGPRFRLLGSQAAYVKWGLDPQEASLAARADPDSDDFGREPEDAWGRFGTGGEASQIPTLRGNYGRFYELLAACILKEGPPPVDPRDALDVVSIIESLHRDEVFRTG